KCYLSSMEQYNIEIPNLVKEYDLQYTLTRVKFEQLCRSLFNQTMDPIYRVITDGLSSRNKIDHVVLVGGSTRIPYIRVMLSNYFETSIVNTVNPDEAVAYGAAVNAAIISGIRHENLDD